MSEQWQKMRLGDMLTLQRGYDLPSRLRQVGSVPIVSSAGPYDFHSVHQVSHPGVVTGRYGTIGDVFYIEEDFWPLNTTLYVSDFKKNSPLYISYLLRTVDFHSHSGKSGVPGVNRNDIHELRVMRPPVEEQTAIANALSDVDALITSLEKLIDKKRAIKTAAMQQLLTGKKRLPPFDKTHSGYQQTELGEIPKDWEVRCLGDIADVKTGPFGSTLHESDYVAAGTPIITVEHLGDMGVTYQNLPLVSASDRERLKTYSLRHGDIAFSRVGSVDRNALISRAEDGWLFSGRILRVRFKSDSNIPAYFSHQFHTSPFKRRVKEVAVGQTMPSLNTQILKSINVLIPSCEDEQHAIDSVLTDMNNDISLLSLRLLKTRQLKQGMMQELLTGKTRLL